MTINKQVIKIHPELYAKIKNLAEDMNMPRPNLIRAIVECFFDSVASKDRGLYKELSWRKDIAGQKIILRDDKFKKVYYEYKKERKGMAETRNKARAENADYHTINERIEQVIKKNKIGML